MAIMKMAVMMIIPNELDTADSSVNVQNLTGNVGQIQFLVDDGKNSKNGEPEQEPISDQDLFKTLMNSELTSAGKSDDEEESIQDDVKNKDVEEEDEVVSSDDEGEDPEVTTLSAAESDGDSDSESTKSPSN